MILYTGFEIKVEVTGGFAFLRFRLRFTLRRLCGSREKEHGHG